MASYITKTTMVYNAIKDGVLSGKYPPGKKINPKEFSEEFNVSPVPVREAINKLASDGLVKLIPHVGACVSYLNMDEVYELLIIRTELESLFAGLSAELVTDGQIRKMEKIVERAEKAIQSENYKDLKQLNRDFHFALFDKSPYRILIKMIKDLYERLQLVPSVQATKKRAEYSLRDHKLILKAFSEKNGKLASELVKKHQSAPWHAIPIEKSKN